MFKVVITKRGTKINGTGQELLNGLCNYIDILKKSGVPKILIKLAIDSVLDNDKFKIQKIDLNNIPKEEREKIINMFFEE